MSLTQKQIDEYREKLGDSKYMKKAVNRIAEEFSTRYIRHSGKDGTGADG
jgi:hypothetical protein